MLGGQVGQQARSTEQQAQHLQQLEQEQHTQAKSAGITFSDTSPILQLCEKVSAWASRAHARRRVRLGDPQELVTGATSAGLVRHLVGPFAMVRTEIDYLSSVRPLRGCLGALDRHPTNRILDFRHANATHRRHPLGYLAISVFRSLRVQLISFYLSSVIDDPPARASRSPRTLGTWTPRGRFRQLGRVSKLSGRRRPLVHGGVRPMDASPTETTGR